MVTFYYKAAACFKERMKHNGHVNFLQQGNAKMQNFYNANSSVRSIANDYMMC